MHKKNIFILIIVLLNAFVSIQSAFSQDALGESVSKNEFLSNQMDFSTAVKYALEHNNNIRAMKNGLSATERDIGIARSEILPKIKFYENFAATNNPTDALAYRLNQARATASDLAIDNLNHPASITNFLTSGAVEQKLLDRKAMIEIKMAKKEYSANGYTYLRKQEELVSQVAQAFLNVITDQEFINIAQKAIDDTKKHLDMAEAKYKSKGGMYSDILRAKSAIEERKEKLIVLERNLKISKRSLGLLLGLQTPVETIGPIPDLRLQSIDYYKSFSVYRNDIKATEIRVENAKNNIKSAQAGWYPTLNAIASYNFYNSNYPFGGQGSNYIAGAFFKWEPIDGNKRKYEILKAKDKEAEAREFLEGFKKTVDFKVYEYHTHVEAHQKSLELAIMAEKAAEDDVKLVEKRWQDSQLPFVAVVDAQANLNEARESVVRQRSVLKVDLINLTYESGIIYQELAIK